MQHKGSEVRDAYVRCVESATGVDRLVVFLVTRRDDVERRKGALGL